MVSLRIFLAALGQLGARRLTLLAFAGAVIFGLLSISVYYLNRPVREVLYTGLDSEDVNRIGSALSEVGIAFDVSVSGDAIMVDFGRTAEARMILAEKGLPKSDKAGYELFDQMGSLGLTSFMQQVTRVRALEGELSRTIQQLEGVKAARVHLGLRSETAFRTKSDLPSASVVIKTDGTAKASLSLSVRQIVAAAIPGLKSEQVTVMTTDGQVLATAGDAQGAEPDRKLDLEQKVAQDARLSAERALSAIVGSSNIRVSVTAQMNIDKKQLTETNYDPESRVERSLKTMKETDENQNSSGAETVSVAQNIPQENPPPAGGDSTKAKKERKEETANYEMNTKQVAVESVGFKVERMSLAVLINKQALLRAQGEKPEDSKLAAQISDIEKLVKSAVGFDEKRGDNLNVLAADFVEEELPAGAEEATGVGAMFSHHLGTLINGLSLLAAIALVLLAGLRPMVKAILTAPDLTPRLPSASESGGGAAVADSEQMFAQALLSSEPPNAKERLNRAVESDMDRAAQVLKQWLEKPKQSAT